ncbi:MAG: LysM peptidoglycan-binding domain-containing protein [Nitrospirae bacterium]|nr:LysM peptidoglycan-binding domain-containing protein [Nitrospirota bacterium]
MKKTYLFFIISLLLYSSNIQAQDNESREYVIQRNDTLWGISNTKLEDPFLWPKLWSVNPHINNPDLIHPGEKIIIPSKEKLAESQPETEKKSVSEVKHKTIKSDIGNAPPAVETPAKLHKKYLVNKNLYISIGWISEDFPGIGKITATPSGRKIAGKNDVVYLSLDNKASLIDAQTEHSKNRFFTIRDIRTVNHPVTGKILGHLIRITGILELIGMDNNTSKAKIISSFEEIQVGDSLMSYSEMDPPLAPDVVRTPKMEGYVVASLFSTELSGKGNIVFLDRGQNDGLQAGDVFSVLSGSPVDRVIGKVQIISLQPVTSAAVVLDSAEEITIGNKWGQK